MLPIAIDNELEFMRTGRDGGDDRPSTCTLVEHLNGLPIVPIAGELDVVLRAVAEDELCLNSVGS